jgi:hypothetical protein
MSASVKITGPNLLAPDVRRSYLKSSSLAGYGDFASKEEE